MTREVDQGGSEEIAEASSEPFTASVRGHVDGHPMSHPQTGLRSRVSRIIGRCYTEDSLGDILHLTSEQIAAAADDLRLLRLVTSEGVHVFPAFQLDGDAIIPGLPDVLRALRTGGDAPWVWSLWLTARNPHGPVTRLADSYIDRLRDGEVDEVVREARRAAASWAAYRRATR